MFQQIAKLKQQRESTQNTQQTPTSVFLAAHTDKTSPRTDVSLQQPEISSPPDAEAPVRFQRPMANVFRAPALKVGETSASIIKPAKKTPESSNEGDPFAHLDVNGTAEIHEPEIEELAQSAQALAILAQYRKSRLEFGMIRMRMGSYLTLIKDNKLWRGVAENWETFLASENLNVHAARQYMAVARKYIFDMDLSEETLGKLSMAGIGALEKAGKVINDENQADLIDVLTNLSEKDAIQRIIEMSGNDDSISDKPTLRVLRMLREFYEMPPDLQVDFLGKVAGNRKRMERERSKDLAPQK